MKEGVPFDETPIGHLPTGALTKVLSYLPMRDILQFGQTSKAAHQKQKALLTTDVFVRSRIEHFSHELGYLPEPIKALYHNYLKNDDLQYRLKQLLPLVVCNQEIATQFYKNLKLVLPQILGAIDDTDQIEVLFDFVDALTAYPDLTKQLLEDDLFGMDDLIFDIARKNIANAFYIILNQKYCVCLSKDDFMGICAQYYKVAQFVINKYLAIQGKFEQNEIEVDGLTLYLLEIEFCKPDIIALGVFHEEVALECVSDQQFREHLNRAHLMRLCLSHDVVFKIVLNDSTLLSKMDLNQDAYHFCFAKRHLFHEIMKVPKLMTLLSDIEKAKLFLWSQLTTSAKEAFFFDFALSQEAYWQHAKVVVKCTKDWEYAKKLLLDEKSLQLFTAQDHQDILTLQPDLCAIYFKNPLLRRHLDNQAVEHLSFEYLVFAREKLENMRVYLENNKTLQRLQANLSNAECALKKLAEQEKKAINICWRLMYGHADLAKEVVANEQYKIILEKISSFNLRRIILKHFNEVLFYLKQNAVLDKLTNQDIIVVVAENRAVAEVFKLHDRYKTLSEAEKQSFEQLLLLFQVIDDTLNPSLAGKKSPKL